MKTKRKIVIALIGGRDADGLQLEAAEQVGRLVAKKGATLVCGGLGGVMEAAAKGAKAEGGLTVGILPQDHKKDANDYIDVAVATGLGVGRNVIITRTADAIIAVGGEYGTLSEIAFGLQMGKPVVGIGSWDIKGVVSAKDAEDAVSKAFDLL